MKSSPGAKASGLLNRSMRARMTLGFTLALAALLIVADASLIAYSRYVTHRNNERLLKQSELEIGNEIAEPLTSGDTPQKFAEEEARELQARGVSLILLDANGRVLFEPKHFAKKNLRNGKATTWPLINDQWFSKGLPWGEYSLVLAVPRGHQQRDLGEVVLGLAGLSILILAACATGAWLMVGRTLAPLEALSQQAVSRQTQTNSMDAQTQLQSPSNDWEMIYLVTTINGLLTRLDADTRAKARFYAAASHELRTPLQGLNGFLELGLSRKRSETEYRATLQEAHAQSRDLITLVNDLLTLNQLESAAAPVAGDEVDMADVAERVLQRLSPQIIEKKLRLDLNMRAAGALCAPWSHMEMLLRNLLENAVKYAACGALVRVYCDRDSFEVFNECAPTSGWDDDKILEPFFRPDAARNSQTGGNGLGLAISKAICDANCWTLNVRQIEGGVKARVAFNATPVHCD